MLANSTIKPFLFRNIGDTEESALLYDLVDFLSINIDSNEISDPTLKLDKWI